MWWIQLTFSFLFGIFIYVIIWAWTSFKIGQKRGKGGKVVILTGPIGTGKTTLFLKLLNRGRASDPNRSTQGANCAITQTVHSQSPNTGLIHLEDKGSLELVDLPWNQNQIINEPSKYFIPNNLNRAIILLGPHNHFTTKHIQLIVGLASVAILSRKEVPILIWSRESIDPSTATKNLKSLIFAFLSDLQNRLIKDLSDGQDETCTDKLAVTRLLMEKDGDPKDFEPVIAHYLDSFLDFGMDNSDSCEFILNWIAY